MSDIFESPDGGKTVYSRPYGSKDRKLVKSSLEAHLEKVTKWLSIVEDAEKNPVLKDMLEKVEIYHALIKKENN